MHIELGNTLTEFVSAFENGIRFDKVVENSSLSLRQSLKLGSLSGNSLRLTLSGNLALCEAFLAYKYLRVTKDDHVVFVGVLQTYNKKTETPTQSEYTVTYKDMAEDWKAVVFCPDTYQAFHNGDTNSYDVGSVIDAPSLISILEEQRDDLYKQYTSVGSDYGLSQFLYEEYARVVNMINDIRNGLGSGEYGWEWSCVKTDGYKVLDMDNHDKSLVHKLISFLPNSNNLTISSSFSRLTAVRAFKVDAKDKILDTLLKVCSQNCIALTLEGLTVKLHDLFRQSGTAKTVAKIEREATLSDKPYIDLTQPDVRWCSYDEEVLYDGPFLGLGKYLFEGESTEVFEPNSYYPSNNQHLWSIPFQPTIPANSELFRTSITNKKTAVYKRGWVGGMYVTNAFPEIVAFKSHGDKCLVRLRNRYVNAKYKAWGVLVSGRATFVGYNSVVTSIVSNGKEETCKYIFSADDARNYDAVRLWSKSSDARYYSFYADDELSLGDLVSLTGVSDEALIIISKTDNLDAFGGYSYTASKVIDSKQVSFDEFYQAIPLDMPRLGDSLKIYASRTEIYCSADGTPQDTTPILVTIDAMSEPTLFIGDQAVPLTRVTKMDGDDEILLDTWEARVSADLGGNGSIVLTASLDDSTVNLTITKMLATGDGGVFVPSISEDGVLSWTNTAGLPNPPSVKIKGSDGVARSLSIACDVALSNHYNRRNSVTDTTTFNFRPIVKNISVDGSTLTWNLQGEYYSTEQNDDGSLTVLLYSDRACNFSVSLSLMSSGENPISYYSEMLSVSDIDETTEVDGKFIGLLEESPESLEGLIDGDYFAKENGEAYELQNGYFVLMPISNPKFVACCGAILESGNELPADSPMGQWVRNLISQNVVAQNIFTGTIDASSATFNNLTINKTSYFKGNIDSDVLKTYNGNAQSYQATCATPTLYWKLSEARTALNSENAIKAQNVTYDNATYPYAMWLTDAKNTMATTTLSIACPLVDGNNSKDWKSITFTIPYNFTGVLNVGKSWVYMHGSTWAQVISAYETSPMRLYLNGSQTPFAEYLSESKTDTNSEYTQQPDIKYWTVPSRGYLTGDIIKLEYRDVEIPYQSIPFGGVGKLNYTATTGITSKWSDYGLVSNSLVLLGQNISVANTKLTSYRIINGEEYHTESISLTSKKWCTWTNNLRLNGQSTSVGDGSVGGTVSISINGTGIGFTPTKCVWSRSGITFSNDSQSVSISASRWYQGFSFSFTFSTTDSYIKTNTLQPIALNGTDIGTNAEPFRNGFFKDLHVNGKSLVDLIYPKDSIFISLADVSPATYFANTTWTKLSAGYALWTASSGAGGTISAGLPNITGYVATNSYYGTNSGVFQASGSNYVWKYNSASYWTQGATFDASRSSSIYGNSSTVQPPAIKVYAWRRTE